MNLRGAKEICCRRISGVYFLFRGGELTYIGQSVSVFTRICDHDREGREFDNSYYIPVPERLLNRVESAFIIRWQPKCGDHIRVSLTDAQARRIVRRYSRRASASDGGGR